MIIDEFNRNEFVCRCEEVTLAEIEKAIADGARSISAVKRYTRAGMGDCQGRTCGRLVGMLLAEITGKRGESFPPDTARFPVHPVSLKQLNKEK